jgi:hypothetical protein
MESPPVISPFGQADGTLRFTAHGMAAKGGELWVVTDQLS